MNMKKILALVLSLALIFSCMPLTLGVSAATVTYYVDANAADGGDGSEGAPFKTLNAALAANTTDDLTIVLLSDLTISQAESVQIMDVWGNPTGEYLYTLSARTGKTTITANEQKTLTIDNSVFVKMTGDLTLSGIKLVSAYRAVTKTEYTAPSSLITLDGHTLTLVNVDASEAYVALSSNPALTDAITLELENSQVGALFTHAGSSGGGTVAFPVIVEAKNSSIGSVNFRACWGNKDWNKYMSLTENLILVLDNSTASISAADAYQGTANAIYAYVTGEGALTTEQANTTYAAANMTTDATITSITPVYEVIEGKLVLVFAIAGDSEGKELFVNGQALVATAGGNYALPTGAVELGFAEITAAPAVVTYLAGEGTGTTPATNAFVGDTVAVTASGFTAPTGKYFVGYTDGVNNYTVGQEITLTGDLELTAVYEAYASTLYVSNSGNNANAGTEAAPLATLGFALANAPAGDVTIKVVGDFTNSESVVIERTGTVTLEGASGTQQALRLEGYINVKTPAVIKNFAITRTAEGYKSVLDAAQTIYANGGLSLGANTTLENISAGTVSNSPYIAAGAPITVTIKDSSLSVFGVGRTFTWIGADVTGDLVIKAQNSTIEAFSVTSWSNGNSAASMIDGNLLVIADNSTVADPRNVVGSSSITGNYTKIALNGGSFVAPEASVAITPAGTTAAYTVAVEGGTVAPVLTGATLNGFTLTPATEGQVPYVDGTKLVANEGIYTLDEGETNISFATEGATLVEVTYAAGEGATGTMAPQTVGVGDVITLPAVAFTKPGYYATVWTDGVGYFAANTGYTVNGAVTFTPVWHAYSTSMYVDPQNVTENADDGNFGSIEAPFATLEKALSLHDGATNIEIYLLSQLTLTGSEDISRTGSITFIGVGEDRVRIQQNANSGGGWWEFATWEINAPLTFNNIEFHATKLTTGDQFSSQNYFDAMASQNLTLINSIIETPVFMQTGRGAIDALNANFNIDANSRVAAIVIGSHWCGDGTDAYTGNVNIVANGGIVGNIVIGNMGHDASSSVALTGDINVTLTNGAKLNKLSTVKSSTITGSVNILNIGSTVVDGTIGGVTPTVTNVTLPEGVTAEVDGANLNFATEKTVGIITGQTAVVYTEDFTLPLASVTVIDLTSGIAALKLPAKANAAPLAWVDQYGVGVDEEYTLTNGLALTATYVDLTDFATLGDDEGVEGAQIRYEDKAFRFIGVMNVDYIYDSIATYNENWKPANREATGIGYGMIAAMTNNVDGALTKETAKSVIVPAVNTYSNDGDLLKFTVCITGITSELYSSDITVVPYITYNDAYGVEHTFYGEQYSANMAEVAMEILLSGDYPAEYEDALIEISGT